MRYLNLLAVTASFATSTIAIAQTSDGPYEVGEWTINPTTAGCSMTVSLSHRSDSSDVDDPSFSLNQDGSETWEHHSSDAIAFMAITNIDKDANGKPLHRFPNPMHTWVEIDGRSFDETALANRGILDRLARANTVYVKAEGYEYTVSEAESEKRMAATAKALQAGKPNPYPFSLTDYRWTILSQRIRTPGPNGVDALRTCATAARSINQPPQFSSRTETAFEREMAARMGGGFGQPRVTCGGGSAIIPDTDWTVSVNADGKITSIVAKPGTDAIARSAEVGQKLLRTLRVSKPGTDAQGHFAATQIDYHSPPTDVGC